MGLIDDENSERGEAGRRKGVGCEEDSEVGSVSYGKYYKVGFCINTSKLVYLAGVLWQDFSSGMNDFVCSLFLWMALIGTRHCGRR